MDNNPLYEMRIMSNERHSHKTVTPAGPHVYENVDTQCIPRKPIAFPGKIRVAGTARPRFSKQHACSFHHAVSKSLVEYG